MKPEGATRLDVIPVTLPVANGYIERWHRHHAPLVTVTANGTTRLNKGFVWFCVGAVGEGDIVGVAVAGRPPNRHSDDGQTVELLRLATDGYPNAASALLGAVARAAKGMGASRVITYTLATESGVSLRAAGWERERDGIETCWTRGRGKARSKRGGNTIWREHMEVEKVRWCKAFREPIVVDVSREGLKEYAASLVVADEHPSLWGPDFYQERDPAISPEASEEETTAGSDGTVAGDDRLDGSAERLSRPATSSSEASAPAKRQGGE